MEVRTEHCCTLQIHGQLVQKIKDGEVPPSPTHEFLKSLRDGGKLFRVYTQNIDGLEEAVRLMCNMTDGPGNKRRFTKKVLDSAPNILSIKHTQRSTRRWSLRRL